MPQKAVSKTLTTVIKEAISHLEPFEREYCAGMEFALALAVMIIESTPLTEVEA